MKKQILLLAALTLSSALTFAQTSYETFNAGSPRLAQWVMKSGMSNLKGIKVANPKKDKVNASDSCGIYVRKANEPYDFLKINVGKMVDVTPFVEGTKKITMLFWSPTAGVNVEIFLQNDKLATNPYPKGRHSLYRTTTSEENKWELLTFEYIDAPDQDVKNTDIDQMLIQVNPNSKDGSTYYFDDIVGPNLAK